MSMKPRLMSKTLSILGSKEQPFKLGRQTIVFATQSSGYFADILARELSVARGQIDREIRPSGEHYYRLDVPHREYLMGKDAIFVGSLCTDDDILETLRIGTQLSLMGTNRCVFLIPFYGYSTMNRQQKPGEVVSAKIHALLLSSIPSTNLGNSFVFFDMHFEGSCLRVELNGLDVLANAVKYLALDNFMFGTTDFGQPKRVEKLAAKFNTDIAFMRVGLGEAAGSQELIGEVKGRTVVIYDDMICTGTRMITAADRYMAHGAQAVIALVSHLGLADQDTARRLADSKLSKIIATNSHPMSQCPAVRLCEKFVILDVTPMFSEVLLVHNLCRV